MAQFSAQCRRHNKQIIYENCMQDDSDVALLLDEPIDASDDEDSFIQAGVSGSGLVELSISGADASGWTIITQAVLRVRGRTYDKTGAGVPLGATMEFRPQDSIHTQAGFTFENPTTGQCCSSRWATYEADLSIPDNDAAKWSAGKLEVHSVATKLSAVQISSIELCLEGE